ncbi:hypothetical protein ABT298_33240 [Streptomyces sp. NPDC001034]|uniref:hypothetical protein n=1 Tax=Streptomyces sp. NPDC001034 TaxID=3154375 RepID=UPI00331AF158
MIDDPEAFLARLRKPTAAEQLAEREAAAAWVPELTTMPMPDFPYRWPHPLGGTARFSCPLGCGWYHDERPDLDAAAQPLVVPLDPDRIEDALTAQADARAEALCARVERAVADHFEQAHPGR